MWGGTRGADGELAQAMPGVNAPVEAPAEMTAGQSIADYEAGAKQEGARAAEYDIDGVLDRQLAQRELAAKLDVVPANYKGPKRPNQVTQAEFESIARTYSNIRLGRGDLTIDTGASEDPAQYQRDMMDDIGDLLQTASGRELVSQLSNNVTGKDAQGNWTHRKTRLGAHIVNGVPDYTNSYERADENIVGKSTIDDHGAPGTGSNTQIGINPNHDVGGSMRSDVALFHEMVHALNSTHGLNEFDHVHLHDGPGLEHDVAEHTFRYEHQAVGVGKYSNAHLVENAYRRERRQLALGAKGMPGDLTMPDRTDYQHSAPYAPVFGR